MATESIKIKETYVFKSKSKSLFIGISVVGLLLVLVSAFGLGTPGKRIWTNLLLSNFFFTAVSIVSLGWICIKYAAKAGWATGFKRLTEAMTGYLPYAAVGFGVMIIATFIGDNNGFKSIYEWMRTDDPHVANDPILQGKKPFLNLNFFIIRVVIYFAVWILFQRLFRKFSLREDAEGAMSLKWYDKANYWSAAFLPIFGLTFCFAAFDWFMSTEPHWYSTIYAVNVFAGGMVAFTTVTVMALVLLQRAGYFSHINANHYHDLGKFMFGFSIFWAYTWVAQFLLIWYANLPEEIPYYLRRLQGNWRPLFFANFIINFLFPLIFLMMRDGKRAPWFLIVVGSILVCGRFIDWYLASMPGAVGPEAGFGLPEIGAFVLFAGMFGFAVNSTLAKAPLIPKNHPFLGESLGHEI